MLVIVGGTNFGKSFLARDVLRKLAANLGVPGFLEVTVEEDTEPSLENFDHRMHSGVLFDGVADALFLHQHREVLQGQAKEEWGGRSATMKFAYPYTLCRRGVVATFDSSARNLDALATNHWLADNRNVRESSSWGLIQKLLATYGEMEKIEKQAIDSRMSIT